MFDIVLFGKPGSGKGTQAELLLDFLSNKIIHLSTGDVFRAIISKPNAIGNYITDRINGGLLVDDKVTISLFNAYFYTVIDSQKAMLLDGYPRTIIQMEEFISLCKINQRKVIGIYFDLEDDVTIQRMLLRSREEENIDMIKKRLKEYYLHTDPLTVRFSSDFPVYTIDANFSVNEIHEQVIKCISTI